MRIDIITCLPDILKGPLDQSILKRAIEKDRVELCIHNLRDYSVNKHKAIDDYAYGGRAGMVMMIEPIDKCIQLLKSQRTYDEIIYMSPDGERFEQSTANELSMTQNLILLCGHYKGVDERVRQSIITREISIGDYVLSGGELAAAVVADTIIRLIPGVLSDESSALTDSFQDGMIAPPVYTRPSEYKGLKVPEVLLSGNDKLIEEWLTEQAELRTKERRPKLLD